MRLSVVAIVSAALAAVLPAAGAQAQSLLAARGLGLVVEPADARSQGLGGVRMGLSGTLFSWANPAEAVGIPVPGLKVAFQYDAFSSSFADREAEGGTARFPLLLGAVPIGERVALSVGVGGFLDQNWAVERFDTLVIGADSQAVQDRFASQGGVVRIRAAAGYRVLPRLSLALGADLFTGGVERSFTRRFAGEVEPACCRTEWGYNGVGGVLGVDWRPTDALRLGAALTSGGTLQASTDDSLAVNASFDLPTTVAAGLSARVAANVLLAASADWSGWSSLDPALVTVGGARDSWAAHGGIEWDGATISERPIPIRLGARHAALPFRWEAGAGEWATERALTAGVGVVLAGGAAVTDLAVERGSRGDGSGLDEGFWRTIFSVTVLGR